MSAVDFHREYLGEPWPESEEDKQLRALVQEYTERTEAYDRTVCTGPIKRGEIMPATGAEFSAINRHARQIREELAPRVAALGKTMADFQQVLIHERKTHPTRRK